MTDLLSSQPPWALWIETLLLVWLCGMADYVTGWQASFYLFFAIPILLMVRFGDRDSAILVALICAVVWWWADHADGHPYVTLWLQIYETAIRLLFFLMVVAAGSSIRSRIELLEQSRRLELEILRISEREQQRIGQDLHDGLCQYFAAIGCAAGSLKQDLERMEAHRQSAAAAEIEELIMQGVSQARSIARGLFPVENTEGGLQSALQELAATTSRLLNIHCTFKEEGQTHIENNLCATHLFRIAQEALHNATRHGKASRASIRLSAADHAITLSVLDNGIGLKEVLRNRAGIGLRTMHYRARTLGGRLQIAAAPGGGTLVSCSFPKTIIGTNLS